MMTDSRLRKGTSLRAGNLWCVFFSCFLFFSLHQITGSFTTMPGFELYVFTIHGELCSSTDSSVYTAYWVRNTTDIHMVQNGTRAHFCDINRLIFNRHCWGAGSVTCSARITCELDDLRVYDGVLNQCRISQHFIWLALLRFVVVISLQAGLRTVQLCA